MSLLDEPRLTHIYWRASVPARHPRPLADYWVSPRDVRYLRRAYRGFRLTGLNPQEARTYIRILMTTPSVS